MGEAEHGTRCSLGQIRGWRGCCCHPARSSQAGGSQATLLGAGSGWQGSEPELHSTEARRITRQAVIEPLPGLGDPQSVTGASLVTLQNRASGLRSGQGQQGPKQGKHLST